MNLLELCVVSSEHTYPRGWRAFSTEQCKAFEPTTLEEMSPHQLWRLKQFGSVEGYVQQFIKLSFCVAGLSRTKHYSLFPEVFKESI